MQKTILFNKSNISYSISGKGKTVVLIHGFGEDSNVFSEQKKYLERYCCVIIPDLPGSGQSELLQFKNEIFIEDYADCIYEILVQENINSCILLGHSMGGYITLHFAEKYPSLLNGFGLIHSTAFADSNEKKENRKKGIEIIEQYGSAHFLKNTIPNLFAEQFKKQHRNILDSFLHQTNYFQNKTLQQYLNAMMLRKDKTYVLSSSKVPVLFILGTEDVATPLNDVLQQTYLPNCSYIHILENVGHMSMLEDGDKLNKLLKDFIEKV